MALDNLLGDVQTEAEAAVVRRGDLSAAMEALEDLIQLVRWNADASIGDRRHYLTVADFDTDENLAALRRVLHGVLEQIAENLLEPITIAENDGLRLRNIEVESPSAHRGVVALHDIANEPRPVNRLTPHLQTSRFDARHVEKLEDQA